MQEVKHRIDGVSCLHLTGHADERGCLTEIYRRSWCDRADFLQWNIVASNANALRGVHVHFRHYDYLLVTSGMMRLGLRDVRHDSTTLGAYDVVELEGANPRIWLIPPGVAHGFYFPVDSTLLYGVSHYWDTADEIACRWDDPDLGFLLTDTEPVLSPRDAAAGSLAEMVLAYSAARAVHG
jgi:dTDP-4-dehydrorhamnose 3,5-epimerase